MLYIYKYKITYTAIRISLYTLLQRATWLNFYELLHIIDDHETARSVFLKKKNQISDYFHQLKNVDLLVKLISKTPNTSPMHKRFWIS